MMYLSGAPTCAPSTPLIARFGRAAAQLTRKYCAFLSDLRMSDPGDPARQPAKR
jgi:hypothetical protein